MTEIKKILFPCDLSENASKIFPYVLSIAEAYNSTIHLLHVVQDLGRWARVYIPHTSMDVLQKEALAGAEKAMNRMLEESEYEEQSSNFQRKIVSGDAVAEILNTIEKEDIDMVIMATHGRKGLEHVLLGSVAENVVRKSPVPVMTVNPYKLK